jgi:hypothetical protein
VFQALYFLLQLCVSLLEKLDGAFELLETFRVGLRFRKSKGRGKGEAETDNRDGQMAVVGFDGS